MPKIDWPVPEQRCSPLARSRARPGQRSPKRFTASTSVACGAQAPPAFKLQRMKLQRMKLQQTRLVPARCWRSGQYPLVALSDLIY